MKKLLSIVASWLLEARARAPSHDENKEELALQVGRY